MTLTEPSRAAGLGNPFRWRCVFAVIAINLKDFRVVSDKGVAGHGENSLDTRQKDRLKRLADDFDDVDLSMVGL